MSAIFMAVFEQVPDDAGVRVKRFQLVDGSTEAESWWVNVLDKAVVDYIDYVGKAINKSKEEKAEE